MNTPVEADWLILTAIAEEYQAMRHQLSDTQALTWQMPASLGRIGGAKVVCVFSGKGSGATTASLMFASARCTAKSIVMSGIAGGFPKHKVYRGDVVIAQTVMGYDFGKLVNGTYIRRPELDFQCDPSLVRHADVARCGPWFQSIVSARPDGKPASDSKVHTGYVASGDKVVDDADHAFFRKVLDVLPEVHAVEMEAIGAGPAIRLLQTEKVARFLMIKGISDEPHQAGSESGNLSGTQHRSAWKAYAAEAAAVLVRSLIEQIGVSGDAATPAPAPAPAAPALSVQLDVEQQAPGHVGGVAAHLSCAAGRSVRVRALEFETLGHWDIPALDQKSTNQPLLIYLDKEQRRSSVTVSSLLGSVAAYPVDVTVTDTASTVAVCVITDHIPSIEGVLGSYGIGLYPFLLRVRALLFDGTRVDCGKVMLSLSGEVPATIMNSTIIASERQIVRREAHHALAALDDATRVDPELQEMLQHVARM